MSLDLRVLSRKLVKNALQIMQRDDAIKRLDPEHYDVASLRTPSRPVRVYKSGDNWKCRSDPTLNQDQPCSHILALLIHLGEVERPNTAADVWKKSKDGRDHALEDQAWRLVPTLLPKLLGDLLREGLAAFGPTPKPVKRGRPWKPIFPQAYQAIMRCAFRESLRSNQGSMETQDNLANNPYGPCGRSTIGRFLANPEHDEFMQKFLALSSWPARDYESLFHPDGTGLTEQHFTQFFEEKHHKPGERRHHEWNFAEFLWTYQFSIKPLFGPAPRKDIALSDLSSGEKQIVSLFSHLYLSGKKRFFVLIDEPELSLSVPWQRRFLIDIRKGEYCAGLVATTHSPFIYENELRASTHAIGEFQAI